MEVPISKPFKMTNMTKKKTIRLTYVEQQVKNQRDMAESNRGRALYGEGLATIDYSTNREISDSVNRYGVLITEELLNEGENQYDIGDERYIDQEIENYENQGDGGYEDVVRRPKRVGFEGLKSHYESLGESTKFNKIDYDISNENRGANLQRGYFKGPKVNNTYKQKPCDPRVIHRMRNIDLAGFDDITNPFFMWLRRRFNYNSDKVRDLCTYYRGKNGCLRITHIRDEYVTDFKERAGYYEDNQDHIDNKKIRATHDIYRIGGVLLHKHKSDKLGLMIWCYSLSRYTITTLKYIYEGESNFVHLGKKEYRDRLRKRILGELRLHHIDPHLLFNLLADEHFSSTNIEDRGSLLDLLNCFLSSEVSTNSMYVDHNITTLKRLSNFISPSALLLPILIGHMLFVDTQLQIRIPRSQLTVQETINLCSNHNFAIFDDEVIGYYNPSSQLNGNNGSYTNTDDHPMDRYNLAFPMDDQSDGYSSGEDDVVHDTLIDIEDVMLNSYNPVPQEVREEIVAQAPFIPISHPKRYKYIIFCSVGRNCAMYIYVVPISYHVGDDRTLKELVVQLIMARIYTTGDHSVILTDLGTALLVWTSISMSVAMYMSRNMRLRQKCRPARTNLSLLTPYYNLVSMTNTWRIDRLYDIASPYDFAFFFYTGGRLIDSLSRARFVCQGYEQYALARVYMRFSKSHRFKAGGIVPQYIIDRYQNVVPLGDFSMMVTNVHQHQGNPDRYPVITIPFNGHEYNNSVSNNNNNQTAVTLRLYGPGYSSDNSGDGPVYQAEIPGHPMVTMYDCNYPNCPYCYHYHRKEKKDKKPGAEQRVAKKTSTTKPPIQKFLKTYEICHKTGCTNPAHLHAGVGNPAKDRKTHILIASLVGAMAESDSFTHYAMDHPGMAPLEIINNVKVGQVLDPDLYESTQEEFHDACVLIGDQIRDVAISNHDDKVASYENDLDNMDDECEYGVFEGKMGKKVIKHVPLASKENNHLTIDHINHNTTSTKTTIKIPVIDKTPYKVIKDDTKNITTTNIPDSVDNEIILENIYKDATEDVITDTLHKDINKDYNDSEIKAHHRKIKKFENQPHKHWTNQCDEDTFYGHYNNMFNIQHAVEGYNDDAVAYSPAPIMLHDYIPYVEENSDNNSEAELSVSTGITPSDKYYYYGILSDDQEYFSTTLKINNKSTYQIWKRDDEEHPVYYPYTSDRGGYGGNQWEYGVLTPGYWDDIRYDKETLLAVSSLGSTRCKLLPDIYYEHVDIESSNYNHFKSLREQFTVVIRGSDYGHVLDGTSYDSKSWGYLQNVKSEKMIVSRNLIDYLVQKKMHVGVVGTTCLSVYVTITTEYPNLPIEIVMGTLLHFMRVRIEGQKVLQGITDHAIEHLKKTIGNTTGLDFLKKTLNGDVGYCVRNDHTPLDCGWSRPDNLSFRQDCYVVDKLSITDKTAYNSYVNPVQPVSSKFSVWVAKNVKMNGVIPDFRQEHIATEELRQYKAVFCTQASRTSTASYLDSTNIAIALNRFLLDRDNEKHKRSAQELMSKYALVVFGYYICSKHQATGRQFLQSVHNELVRLIKEDCTTTARHQNGNRKPQYNRDVLGIKIDDQYQGYTWDDVYTQYYYSTNGVVDPLVLFNHIISDITPYTSSPVIDAQCYWLIGVQSYMRTYADSEYTKRIIEHVNDPLMAMETYFTDLGGDKYAYRMGLLADARQGIPEFKKVYTNSVEIKKGEVLKQKVAKFGPKKGEMVDQYLRTVISIIGQSYLDADPDIIAYNKYNISRHPIYFQGDVNQANYTICMLLEWDQDIGVISHEINPHMAYIPFRVSKNIVLVSAVNDGDSRKLSTLYSALLSDPVLNNAYIGISFGDDMISIDRGDNTWAEADISANDGSYTDSISRLSMYSTTFANGGLSIPAWAQRARPYKVRSPDGTGYILYESLTGINLPSGSSLTTSQNTEASLSIHIAIAMTSRDRAQELTGFDLSGVESTRNSTHVGFLSNINYHDKIAQKAYCVQHPGVVLRSIGMSKISTWDLDKSCKRYTKPNERGYIFTIIALSGYISTHMSMSTGIEWFNTFDDLSIDHWDNTHNDHTGVPSYLLALAKLFLLISPLPRTYLCNIVNSKPGVVYSAEKRILSGANEFDNRYGDGDFTEFKFDRTDYMIASAYTSQKVSSNQNLQDILRVYHQYMQQLLAYDTTYGVYGYRFQHPFVDMAMKMRYDATGY